MVAVINTDSDVTIWEFVPYFVVAYSCLFLLSAILTLIVLPNLYQEKMLSENLFILFFCETLMINGNEEIMKV